jgi:hypothetical protein
LRNILIWSRGKIFSSLCFSGNLYFDYALVLIVKKVFDFIRRCKALADEGLSALSLEVGF